MEPRERGTARTLAEKLEMNEVAELLQTTIEVREADERLTEVSESLLGDLIANEDTAVERSPARGAAAPKVKRSSGH